MRRKPQVRYIPTDGRTRRLWIYFGVAAFVVVDILLVLWAVSARNTPPLAAAPTSSSPANPMKAPSPSSTPEPTESNLSANTTAVPPTRIITALNDKVAWRATTGSCPETPASPEYTLDGGITWTTTDATGPTDVTAIQSITVEDEGIASMIGLSAEDCSPEFIKTFIAGDNYRSYPDQLEDAWYVDPANRSVLQTAGGEAAAPCADVVAFSARDNQSVAVLCVDQTIFVTSNSADTWSAALTISGAVNLAISETGYTIATVGKAECAGVQLSTLSAEGVITIAGCLDVDMPLSALSEVVCISEAEGSLWVWVGDIVKKSLDGGATWE